MVVTTCKCMSLCGKEGTHGRDHMQKGCQFVIRRDKWS